MIKWIVKKYILPELDKRLDEEIKRLKNEKIKIEGGKFVPHICGDIEEMLAPVAEGFQIREHAEIFAKQMKFHRVIQQRAFEIDPDWRADYSNQKQEKCHLYCHDGVYRIGAYSSLKFFLVEASRDTMEQICDELNSGRLDPWTQ